MEAEGAKAEPRKNTAVTRYVWGMRILGVIYILVAITFFFYSTELIYLINVGPKVFKITEAITEPTEHFWIVLATSLVAGLSALSFLSAESPRIRGYALVQLLTKVVSIAGFIVMFLNDHRYFAYLVGIGTDTPIALFVAWSMIRLPRGHKI